MEGDYGERKGKGCQVTCLKDTWPKPKQGTIQGGKWGWVEREGVVRGKWRQQYLRNNENTKKFALLHILSFKMIIFLISILFGEMYYKQSHMTIIIM